jgi:hypothetical protein
MEIKEEWEYPVLRTVIAAHDTENVNGKSTALEMAAYLSGRYSQQTLDEMRAEAQTDDPDLDQIMTSAEGLDAYSNG